MTSDLPFENSKFGNFNS